MQSTPEAPSTGRCPMHDATVEPVAPAQASAPLRRAPGFSGLAALRLLFAWGKNRIAPIEALAKTYPDLVRLQAGGLRFYFLFQPELIQECLVARHKSFRKDRFFVRFVRLILGNGILTSDGEEHLRERRLLHPAFHRERIRGYAETMIQCTTAAESRWRDGARIDVAQEMMGLTLDIVGRTLFGLDVRDEAQTVARAIETIIARNDVLLIPLFPRLLKLPLRRNRAFHRAIADLDAVLFRMIEAHRAQPGQDDLLSMLLDARYEGGGKMTDRQLRDEALTIFTSGHETTALALTWCWRMLAENPHCEAQLHRELDEVLGGRTPTPEDFPRLEYTQRVFKESLRLYPPTIMVGREALEDTAIGPYRIERGAIVISTPYITHRDARGFPDPERFDPDRWLPQAAEGRHRFAYFPFGGGQRQCIGEGFAMMEAVLVLATLAQKWTLRPVPGHAVAVEPRLTMRPKDGMPMILKRRTRCRA